MKRDINIEGRRQLEERIPSITKTVRDKYCAGKIKRTKVYLKSKQTTPNTCANPHALLQRILKNVVNIPLDFSSGQAIPETSPEIYLCVTLYSFHVLDRPKHKQIKQNITPTQNTLC